MVLKLSATMTGVSYGGTKKHREIEILLTQEEDDILRVTQERVSNAYELRIKYCLGFVLHLTALIKDQFTLSTNKHLNDLFKL